MGGERDPSKFSIYLTGGVHITSISGMVRLYYSQSNHPSSGEVGGSFFLGSLFIGG